MQVFRHGDRTPTKSELYKNLAYNPIYDSLGYGQLTDVSTYYILIIHKLTFSMKYSSLNRFFIFMLFLYLRKVRFLETNLDIVISIQL